MKTKHKFTLEDFKHMGEPKLVLTPTKGLNAQQVAETGKALLETNAALIASSFAVNGLGFVALSASALSAAVYGTLRASVRERQQSFEAFYLKENYLSVVSVSPQCPAPAMYLLKAHWTKAKVIANNSFDSEMEPQLRVIAGGQQVRIGKFLDERDLSLAADAINTILQRHNGPYFY